MYVLTYLSPKHKIHFGYLYHTNRWTTMIVEICLFQLNNVGELLFTIKLELECRVGHHSGVIWRFFLTSCWVDDTIRSVRYSTNTARRVPLILSESRPKNPKCIGKIGNNIDDVRAFRVFIPRIKQQITFQVTARPRIRIS